MDKGRLPAAGASVGRVIFISGFARSGSTLLGRLLALSPGVIHVGELTYIWERGLAENQLCGCGVPFRECPFWTDVLYEAFGRKPLTGAQIANLSAARHYADYLPRAAMSTLPLYRSRRITVYASTVQRLLSGISAVSGAWAVVDSSKRPAHGMVLAEACRGMLSTVHLVRDPRAVCHSTMRLRKRPEVHSRTAFMPTGRPLRQAARWVAWNAAAEVAARAGQNSVRVSYEQLALNPANVTRTVLDGVGLRSAESPILDGGAVELPPDHSVSGNPMRFESGVVRIREDSEWMRALSRRNRRVITMMTGPLLIRYGYAIRDSATLEAVSDDPVRSDAVER